MLSTGIGFGPVVVKQTPQFIKLKIIRYCKKKKKNSNKDYKGKEQGTFNVNLSLDCYVGVFSKSDS